MSGDPGRQARKSGHLHRILGHKPDFVMLQETHATDGSVLTWKPPEGYQLHYLNGTASIAGVGILIRHSFLANFDTPLSLQLDDIVPGRIGRLRLHGSEGDLDLYTVYLTTGDAKVERAAQRRALAKALAPPERALSIIGGDWNFTSEADDRAILATASNSEFRDAAEQKDFCNLMETKGIFELTQDEYTHKTTSGLSKIDRVYVNYGPAIQLDHQIDCSALPWPEVWVSAHRPLMFSCRPPMDKNPDNIYIEEKVLDDPGWHHRVLLQLEHLKAQDEENGFMPSGTRELILLKRAVVQVCEDISRERRLVPPPHVSDDGPNDLALIMSFLRAVKKQYWWRARTLARRLACLSPFKDIDHRGHHYEAPLRQLQSKAMELARKGFIEDLRREQAQAHDTATTQNEEGDEPYRANRRGQVLARLARLKPGASTTIHSMADNQGNILNNTADKLHHLKEHWTEVFTAKEYSDQTADRWFRKAYPDGKGLEDFPSKEPDQWSVRKSDIKKAISVANRSAPGPDGIPYKAWKLLGETAVNVLWRVARELQLPESKDYLQQAYRDEESCGFNTGLLVFLPKKPSKLDEFGNPAYTASDTRPLCIVDTANRLVANAARLRWEQNLGTWLAKEQHGFLPRRSMLANVVDLELSSMHYALKHQAPATVLYDFSAAFPSLSQGFLIRTLENLGLPQPAVQLVKALYYEHKGVPSLAGSRGDSFHLSAGIRQRLPALSALVRDGGGRPAPQGR
jgi:exonuclease III